MAMTQAERAKAYRDRKRGSPELQLANRRQLRAAAEDTWQDFVQMKGSATTIAKAAIEEAKKGIAAARRLSKLGPDGALPDPGTLREARLQVAESLALMELARSHLPAPAADPPPLSVALPRYPEESRSDYAALVQWYQAGCETDPPDGNRDWVSRAAMASAYSAMDEGTESVGIGVRLGLPASTLAGHALYARLGRDKLAAVSKVTGEPVE